MMSRQHYEGIAEILVSIRKDRVLGIPRIKDNEPETIRAAASLNTLLDVQMRLGEFFRRDNPRFDIAKWDEACRAVPR